MELNGIANIICIVNMSQIDPEVSKKILEQCDLLERYLTAVSDCRRNNKSIPYWHEVRDNKERYLKRGT